MQVTVDPKVLIQAIEAHNPGVDLTGVKAYLFDLVTGSGHVAASVTSSVTVTNSNVPTPRAPSPVEDEPQSADDLLAAMMGGTENLNDATPSQVLYEPPAPTPVAKAAVPSPVAPSKKVVVTAPKTVARSAAMDDKARREAKRAETAKFANMSGKEVIEALTSQAAPKKKEGQNQFTDMGSDSTGGGFGDIEIG